MLFPSNIESLQIEWFGENLCILGLTHGLEPFTFFFINVYNSLALMNTLIIYLVIITIMRTSNDSSLFIYLFINNFNQGHRESLGDDCGKQIERGFSRINTRERVEILFLVTRTGENIHKNFLYSVFVSPFLKFSHSCKRNFTIFSDRNNFSWSLSFSHHTFSSIVSWEGEYKRWSKLTLWMNSNVMKVKNVVRVNKFHKRRRPPPIVYLLDIPIFNLYIFHSYMHI